MYGNVAAIDGPRLGGFDADGEDENQRAPLTHKPPPTTNTLTDPQAASATT